MQQPTTLIAHHARYRPEQAAVVFADGRQTRRLTWRQFHRRVNRLANALLALGIKKGDRVATVLPNSLELLEIYWAVPRIGAVLVPLSPLLNAAPPPTPSRLPRPAALSKGERGTTTAPMRGTAQ